MRNRPGWCGSVDWVPACKPKGWWFDSQSRAHAWVAGQAPSRGCMKGNYTVMFLSLSPSLPLCKNKWINRSLKKYEIENLNQIPRETQHPNMIVGTRGSNPMMLLPWWENLFKGASQDWYISYQKETGYSFHVLMRQWESLFVSTCELILWSLPIPNTRSITVPQQELVHYQISLALGLPMAGCWLPKAYRNDDDDSDEDDEGSRSYHLFHTQS